ncbi:MAG: hypothetical protein JXI43_06380 [Tissierellales bacterium]|nr:hypothetical protein [Tissierellales bacterium]
MQYLKNMLFRIFKEDRYSELIMGAEYKKALKIAFPLMEKDDQSSYISLAKDLFSHASKEEEILTKKMDGSQIFSIIGEFLLDNQIAELLEVGFDINPAYVPSPTIGPVRCGFVNAKGPLKQEELHSISVRTIAEKLKGVWSPARLIEQDVERDFLNPLNAEGMGKLLIEDVKTRLREYLEHANEFLDPKNLDLHYLYSLLSGFSDAIEKNTESLTMADWDRLIEFCQQIIVSRKEQLREQQEYEINEHNAWLGRLGRWNAVHAEMIKMLKTILGENGIKLGFEWNHHRHEILSIIEYSFDHPDPTPDDEQINTAKITELTEGQEPLVSDPFTIAINSIRGQSFELFVLAVNLDRVKNHDFESVELSEEIKKLYEYLLNKEKTRAIMFMFGHYLPMFFFRDKNWLKSILHKIFPTDKGKRYLYLAAWEGFLYNNLYIEIIKDKDFQRLYKRAIMMTEKDYPYQKHFIDPDEKVAQHFSLAYLHSDINFGSELFDSFWTDGSIRQHIAFVDSLGRSFFSSQNPETLNYLRENENTGRKIKDMWNWLLDNYSDPKVFDGIGFWIDLDKGIFQANELASYLAKTLAKTDGYLKWEIGLQKNIVELAKNAPECTIDITRLYLLEGILRKRTNSHYFILDKKWIEAFRILYTQTATKQATLSLINDLIREGGNYFWQLKEVLDSI